MIRMIGLFLFGVLVLAFSVYLVRKPDPRFVSTAALAEAKRIWVREILKVGLLSIFCIAACAMPVGLVLALLFNVK